MASLPPQLSAAAFNPSSVFGESSPLPPEPVATPLAPSLPAQPMQQPSEIPVTPENPGQPKLIDKLKPDSDLHEKTLTTLKAMLKFSRDEMKKNYSRWNFGEARIQGYCAQQDYGQLVTHLRVQGAQPPEPVSVIVPYSYATLHAAATFIASVLLNRKPVFPLLAVRGSSSENARFMEMALQQNLDASRGFEELWQLIWDSLIYSFNVTKVDWTQRFGRTVRWTGGQRLMTDELKFAGNTIRSVDPYATFPDPRVPISQCNKLGDFFFIEIEQSQMVLYDLERKGQLKWVKEMCEKSKGRSEPNLASEENRRRIKIGISGEQLITPSNVVGFKKLYEGTVRLNPKDWGFQTETGDSQLYKFTFNDHQIIQAEPLNMIHEQHPFVGAEPASFGHDFMSVAMADMIGPFQDILSWLVSSRMENVRTAINNQFVADPARVEVNDIRSSVIGRVIRLKQAAMGTPINSVIQQLAVQDVTTGHLNDIQTMRVLADTITGVNDNMRGIQTAGGRRSATEARMSMQAGASRLSQMAVRISSQAFNPLVEQMIYNIQQFMPLDMWVETTGDDGNPNSFQLTEDMLVGSYNFQVSDGALPFDKMAMLESWKEILFGVARDPELRQEYDLGKIFNYVAQLGGAKNIDSFKKQPAIQMQAAADPASDPSLQPVGAMQPQSPISAGEVFGAA